MAHNHHPSHKRSPAAEVRHLVVDLQSSLDLRRRHYSPDCSSRPDLLRESRLEEPRRLRYQSKVQPGRCIALVRALQVFFQQPTQSRAMDFALDDVVSAR